MNKLNFTFAAVVGLVLACCFEPGIAAQQDPGRRPELQQHLENHYRLTVVGPGLLGLTGSRSTIRRAGGVVVVRRAGIDGSLDRESPALSALREGKAEMYRGRKDAAVAPGERFYVYSLQVGSDVVTLGLVSVRTISTSGGSGPLWTGLSFFFPPEALAEGNLEVVYRVMDQWVVPEESYRLAGGQSAPEPEPPPAPPSELKPGMTRDEVVAALGPARREVSFGARTWLTYTALVVVLEQGKLVSVDRSGQPPAKVSVASEPDGAEIYVDSSFVGSTPASLELPAGTYKVSVRLSSYKDWERELKVLGGSEITLRARLEK